MRCRIAAVSTGAPAADSAGAEVSAGIANAGTLANADMAITRPRADNLIEKDDIGEPPGGLFFGLPQNEADAKPGGSHIPRDCNAGPCEWFYVTKALGANT